MIGAPARNTKFLTFLFSLCFVLSSFIGQAQSDWSELLFDSKDGLPSREIYNVIENDEGEIFVATDQGVYKIRGQAIVRYTKEDGLGSNTIFKLFKDPSGNIWALCFEGGIRIFKNNKWIEPPFNQSFIDDIGYRDFPYAISFTEDNHVYLESLIKNPFFHLVDLNDSSIYKIEIPSLGLAKVPTTYFLLDKDGQPFFGGTDMFRDELRLLSFQARVDLARNDEITTDTVEVLQDGHTFNIVRFDRGNYGPRLISSPRLCYKRIGNDWLFEHGLTLFSIDNDGGASKLFDIDSPVLDIEYFEDRVYIATDENGILEYIYHSATNLELVGHYFEGESVSDIFIDSRKNFWVTLTRSGLARVSSFNWKKSEIADFNYRTTTPLALTSDTTGFTTIGSNVIDMKRITNGFNSFWTRGNYDKYEQVASTEDQINYIKIENNHLYFKHFRIDITDTSKGFENYFGNPKNRPVGFFSNIREIVPSIGSDNLHMVVDGWAASFYGIGNLDTLANPDESTSVTDILVNGDSIEYASSSIGILKRVGTRLVQAFPDFPEAQTEATQIKRISDNWVAVLMKSRGIIIFNDDTLIHLTSTNFLIDDLQNTIGVADNYLFAASINNLFIAKLNDEGIENHTTIYLSEIPGIQNIDHIYTYNGTLMLYDDETIITSSIDKLPLDSKEADFEISSVAVNSVVRELVDSKLILNRGENTVKIDLSSTIPLSFGAPLYLWRLHEGDPWQYSSNGEILLVNLTAGSYDFEVKYRDERGNWKKTRNLFSFKVRSPLIETFWFWGLLSSPVLLFFLYIAYTSRKSRALNKELIESNMASLKMQINPHFIFNAFNSIQYLITSKNNDTASEYLSRLAKLIRKTIARPELHRTSLKEELEYISEFMAIERMRLNDSFTYTVTIDPKIEDTKVEFIPPMLLQPILENSVWHGVSNMGTEGKIELEIIKQNEALEIHIKDNGSGFPRDVWNRIVLREEVSGSLGLKNVITRLELLSELYNKKYRLELVDSGSGTHFVLTLAL